MATVEERFWAKVRMHKSCWIWVGARSSSGYGNFNAYGKTHKAHRFAYELMRDEIPEGMIACHSCDNPLCVNPDHVFIGTKKDNSDDMYAKGRGRKARGSAHGLSKLSESDVIDIRSKWRNGARQVDLAKEYGVHQTCISSVTRKKWWRHVGEESSR